jgi:hypothetical protein
MWDHGTARRAGPASGAGFSVIKVAYVADRAAPGGVCRQHRISQVGYLIARLSSAFGTELLLGTAILRVGGLSQPRAPDRIVRWLTHRCCKPL